MEIPHDKGRGLFPSNGLTTKLLCAFGSIGAFMFSALVGYRLRSDAPSTDKLKTETSDMSSDT